MKKRFIFFIVTACSFLVACNQGDHHKDSAKDARVAIKNDGHKINVQDAANPDMFTFSSPDLQNNQNIPLNYICKDQGGMNQTPSFTWKNPPAGTQSFALLVTDPDAPNGNWVHWMVYNIPGNALSLSSNDLSQVIQGENSWGKAEYDGPCPPAGKPHHYVFTLYAFTEAFPAKPVFSLKAFEYIVTESNAVLGKAELVGTYQKP